MLQFTQFREESKGETTLSKLYLGLDYICDILEDQVREIPGVPVAEWKIHSKTAIPVGNYRITAENSGKFGPNTLTVNNVDGFDYIRIHGGNDAENTEGCLLPGVRVSNTYVTHSQDNLTKVKKLVLPELEAGEEVWWEIVPFTPAV